MSNVVVVVGPTVIVGPGPVGAELASTALECIDDDLALVDDRVRRVDELWIDVMRSAMSGPCPSATLILPSWWANSRVDRIARAAEEWATNPVVLRRRDVLTSHPTVVELAPQLAMVHADGQRVAIARPGASVGIVESIVARVDGLGAVLIDAPRGLTRFGAELSVALRRNGVDAEVVDDRALAGMVRAQHRTALVDGAPFWRRMMTPRAAAMAVAGLSATALAGAALGMRVEPVDASAATWLVEGRIAVEIPAQWTVERVTTGPGSARLQVVSPADRSAIIHVTQAGLPSALALADSAETLRAALASEPDGVFVDFTPNGERARRPAITYREIRPDRRIDWTVLVDGDVRIAIGCQGSAEQPGPEKQCERAIGSAHAIDRK